MRSVLYWFIGVVCGGAGVWALGLLRQRWQNEKIVKAEETAKLIVEEAQKESSVIKKEAEVQAKDVLLQSKTEFEKEQRERRKEIQQSERRLQSREETIEKRAVTLDNRETELSRREQGFKTKEEVIDEKAQEYQGLIEETRQQLEQIAGMNREEAKNVLLEKMMSDARTEAARQIMTVEEEAREEAERRARKIISVAVERLAGEFVSERTTAVIPLPSDDMKGRIIGR